MIAVFCHLTGTFLESRLRPKKQRKHLDIFLSRDNMTRRIFLKKLSY
jgi:hypothetical protein